MVTSNYSNRCSLCLSFSLVLLITAKNDTLVSANKFFQSLFYFKFFFIKCVDSYYTKENNPFYLLTYGLSEYMLTALNLLDTLVDY